jgi:hypothetical protein
MFIGIRVSLGLLAAVVAVFLVLPYLPLAVLLGAHGLSVLYLAATTADGPSLAAFGIVAFLIAAVCFGLSVLHCAEREVAEKQLRQRLESMQRDDADLHEQLAVLLGHRR